MTAPAEIRARINQVIDENRERFIQISKSIWENPEIGFAEYKAQAALAAPLAEAGLGEPGLLESAKAEFRQAITSGQ